MKRQCPSCKSYDTFYFNKIGQLQCKCGYVFKGQAFDASDEERGSTRSAPSGGIMFGVSDLGQSRTLNNTLRENSGDPNQKNFENKQKISQLCQNLHQDSREFIEHAQNLFEKSNELENTNAIKKTAIIVASVYLTSCELKAGLLLNEICAVCQNSNNKITPAECQKAVDWMKKLYPHSLDNPIESVAQHFANKLHLHPRVVQCIYKFGTLVNENNILESCHPETRAAAIIYFVLSKNSQSSDIKFYRPISDIQKVSGVEPSTIRSKIASFALLENVLVNSNEFKQMKEAMTSGV